MSDEQPQKPKFEPPPWEREAFERFRAEQEEARRLAERAEAAARAAAGDAAAPDGSTPPTEVAAAPPVAAAAPGGAESSVVAPAGGPAAASGAAPAQATLSDARIDSMLIQLKGEEPVVGRVNMAFINALIALFEASGLFVIVQAALLFGRVRATGAAGMLGALASLIMLLVGLGFMGAGFVLFRKHHS